jgi:Photosynthetic reaction centre cytochrome C subunit
MSERVVQRYAVAKRATALVLCVAALLFCRGAAAQTNPPESRENLPAEQVFKNIQALKGMRAGDLQGAMSFIASSLNVDCDHCHVQDFSKDERKEKLRAREMIRMVRQINEGSFHGENTVNCFTCHQGHAQPIGLAPIVPPPPRAPKAEASVAEKSAGPPLPSVTDVLDHYLQALGGQTALAGVRSQIIKTTRLNGGNSESITMIYQKGPGKVLLAKESPSYSLWVGFDGKRAWAQDSLKSYWGLLNTPQHNAILRDTEIYQGSRIKSEYSNVKVKGIEKVDEQDTYVVSGTSPEGTSEDFYFDVQSGLLLRRHIEEQPFLADFK